MIKSPECRNIPWPRCGSNVALRTVLDVLPPRGSPQKRPVADHGSVANFEDGRVEVNANHGPQFVQRTPIPRGIDRFVRALVSPYPLSYEHVSELVAERGVELDASCIWRWVQAYAPELNKRCRRFLKPTNKSYRIDESYSKVKGQDKYLYRALDSTGQTIDFLLAAKRDCAAAKRFLAKAIEASGNPMPRVMNVDKNPAYPAAVEALKADNVIPRRVVLRQSSILIM